MLQNILFQLLALLSNIVTQPGRQTSFHTVWGVFETCSCRLSAANMNTAINHPSYLAGVALAMLAVLRRFLHTVPASARLALRLLIRHQSQLADCWEKGAPAKFQI